MPKTQDDAWRMPQGKRGSANGRLALIRLAFIMGLRRPTLGAPPFGVGVGIGIGVEFPLVFSIPIPTPTPTPKAPSPKGHLRNGRSVPWITEERKVRPLDYIERQYRGTAGEREDGNWL